ncbi:MAG: hypothetical protein O2894_10495 [Planctomycetota bacterium]|nr:hypothetical protein [Planctomycetota bacterium]
MAVPLLVLVVAGYAAVATGYLEARRRREATPRWARWAGPLTVAAHLGGLLLLSLATERSPFTTLGQSLSFLAFSLGTLYLVLEATSRVATHGGGFYALAAAIAALSVPGLTQGEPLAWADAPRDVARSMHIGLALMSTAAILAGGLLALGYLGTHARVKRKQWDGGAHGPSLDGFQRLLRRASLLGVALLAPAFGLGLRAHADTAGPLEIVGLTGTIGVLLALLITAFWIWWRRPRFGPLAAWLNIAAVLALVLGFGVIHPLVLRGGL